MKTRTGFVSNSSSTSFIIRNVSNEVKTLVDFVDENPDLMDQFLNEYDWYKKDPHYTLSNLRQSAEANNIKFDPHSTNQCAFGDEDGTLIGHVFDYILREGGTSKSFIWAFHEFWR